MKTLKKYPSTQHLSGSGIQKGDSDLTIPISSLVGKFLIIEEKLDGANTGISFNPDTLELQLQSRGHFLTGGDWLEFDLFKKWANSCSDKLFDIIGVEYIMYGEWMYAFHSIYYDKLPHFFMEFDIYDRKRNVFLDTPTRQKITKGNLITSVPVLDSLIVQKEDDVLKHVNCRSLYVSDQSFEDIENKMAEKNFPESLQKNLTSLNKNQLREGIYVKVEGDGIVKERYKFVRSDFVQTILADEIHWSDRPTIPNEMDIAFLMYN